MSRFARFHVAGSAGLILEQRMITEKGTLFLVETSGKREEEEKKKKTTGERETIHKPPRTLN